MNPFLYREAAGATAAVGRLNEQGMKTEIISLKAIILKY